VPFLEARQKVDRFRHPNRLWFGDCELDGDKAGRVTSPGPAPKELES
jgi:hypothetical protein